MGGLFLGLLAAFIGFVLAALAWLAILFIVDAMP